MMTLLPLERLLADGHSAFVVLGVPDGVPRVAHRLAVAVRTASLVVVPLDNRQQAQHHSVAKHGVCYLKHVK